VNKSQQSGNFDLQPSDPELPQRPDPSTNRRGLLLLLLLAFIFFLILDLAILAYFFWPEQKNMVTHPEGNSVQKMAAKPASKSAKGWILADWILRQLPDYTRLYNSCRSNHSVICPWFPAE